MIFLDLLRKFFEMVSTNFSTTSSMLLPFVTIVQLLGAYINSSLIFCFLSPFSSLISSSGMNADIDEKQQLDELCIHLCQYFL